MTRASLISLDPNPLSVFDYVIAGFVCPVLIDVYYGLLLPSSLKIKNYNTYYVLGYRFLYVLSAFPSLFFKLQCFYFLMVELVWVFFTSYVGKFGLVNSTFIFEAQMTGNALFIILITQQYIKISNNFEYDF